MEDSKSLVTVFLQKIFHDRHYVIDTTYKLIYDYNNGDRKKMDYEKTLKSICTLLGKEIPNQVLVYLLTLVDMPLDLAESDDTQLKPVIAKIKTLEEMQKTQNCLTDTIKPHLEECGKPEKSEDDEEPKPREVFSKPGVKHSRSRRKAVAAMEKVDDSRTNKMSSLLDLAAKSVVKNQWKLKRVYQRKFDKAWKMINSNQCKGTSLEQCYSALKDLNKKRKLLRDIENDNITEEVVAELYQDVDIFLKEKHMYEVVNVDLLEGVEDMFNED